MKVNLKKIRAYNQVLFATVSTVVVFSIVVLFTIFIYDTFLKNRDNKTETMISNDLISHEQVKGLSIKNQRLQIASFSSFMIFDKKKKIDIFTISQATLKEPEIVYEKSMSCYSMEGYYNRGSYSNIVFYDRSTKKSRILFKKRLNIDRFYNHEFNDEFYLIALIQENDSNNDGKINAKDKTSICIYSYTKDEIKFIRLERKEILYLEFIEDDKNSFYIVVGLDRNNDNVFEAETEPKTILLYSISTKTLRDVIDKNISKKLQSIMDGEQLGKVKLNQRVDKDNKD